MFQFFIIGAHFSDGKVAFYASAKAVEKKTRSRENIFDVDVAFDESAKRVEAKALALFLMLYFMNRQRQLKKMSESRKNNFSINFAFGASAEADEKKKT